jgi:probable F420-dependent oxidoreductase
MLSLNAPGGAMDGVADAARAIEDAGFDGVSYAELTSDPMLHLTLAASTTSRIDLATNLLVAFARSPMTLAVQAHALQDYSRGRLVLGLGSQIRPHIERRFSMPWSSPAARMTEFVTAMRAIWHAWSTGEKLDFRGDFYTHTLMTPMFTPPALYPDPKVFVAGVGPRMTETAGAVADGLLVHGFTTERYLREVTVPALRDGRAKAGKDLAGFDVCGSPLIVTGRTDEEMARARAGVRQQIAFYGSTPAYHGVLEVHGWGDLGRELHQLSRTGQWQEMGERIDDEVVDAFAVVAEPDKVAGELLSRYGDLMTRMTFYTPYDVDGSVTGQIATDLQAVTS